MVVTMKLEVKQLIKSATSGPVSLRHSYFLCSFCLLSLHFSIATELICQEALENLGKAFQNVMDLHFKVSSYFIGLIKGSLGERPRTV